MNQMGAKLRALEARILAMPGGWDDIFEAIEDGATYRTLAEKFGVSRSFMHRVVMHDDARRLRAENAYKVRADAMMDQSLDIADTVNVNLPASVQKAKLQIELRQWLAAVDNARYKKAAQVEVNLTIGQLHLDALRRRTLPAQVSQPALPTPAIEAEFTMEEKGETDG